MDKLFFGVPLEWVDNNQLLIEQMWDHLGNPQIYSGHMHRNIDVENYTIININHVMMV
jgi:hypothetical protein